MPRPSNRSRILDAAETVAVQMGAAHLTLEAVAAKAKVSKGGLLYHFKDKDAMLTALVQRYMAQCVDKRAQQCARLGGDAKALVKASVLQICDDKTIPLRLHHTLLTASANNPRMLDPARVQAQANMEKIRRSLKKPEEALLVMLAANGLRFLDLIQLQPFTPAERQAVIKYMLDMADGLESLDAKPTVNKKTVPVKKAAAAHPKNALVRKTSHE